MNKELYKEKNSMYCYKNSNTLINKLDIKDRKRLQAYEAKITAVKQLSLRQKGITGDFSIQHLKEIHMYLFEDVYEFAGIYRKENIAKGEFRFAEWEYIEVELQKLLIKLKDENYLQGYNKKKLANRLAYYMSELNVLHPFREGNGRTTREFIRQIALKNGYILNLKKISAQEILNASIKSIIEIDDLASVLEECLEENKN